MFSWTRRIWFLKPCLDFVRSTFEMFSSKVQKLLNYHEFFKKIFAKSFPGQLVWSFGNPAVIFLSTFQNFQLKARKVVRNHFFQQPSFPQKVSLETQHAVLAHMLKRFRAKFEIFRSKYKITEKSYFFIFFCLKHFLRRRRLKFRTPCRQFFARSGSFLLEVRKSVRNHRFLKEKCSKDSSRNAECSYDNSCRIVLPKIHFFFTQSTKLLKNHHFLKFFLSQNFSPDT